MGKTNFDRITASQEALAAFLASLPCLDAPWDDAFTVISATTAHGGLPQGMPQRGKKKQPRVVAGAGGIRVMEVNVKMSAEEFLEFMAWKRDREQYNNEMAARAEKMELMAKKTCWAIEKDPKRPGKVKIVDQETRGGAAGAGQ